MYHHLGKPEGFSLGCVQSEVCMCTRNPVKAEASANFWSQEQSPECGGLAIHYHPRASKLVSSWVLIQQLHCLKTFHSSKENKPSTIFPVCRGLPFKKRLAAFVIRPEHPLRYLLVQHLSPVGSFRCTVLEKTDLEGASLRVLGVGKPWNDLVRTHQPRRPRLTRCHWEPPGLPPACPGPDMSQCFIHSSTTLRPPPKATAHLDPTPARRPPRVATVLC